MDFYLVLTLAPRNGPTWISCCVMGLSWLSSSNNNKFIIRVIMIIVLIATQIRFSTTLLLLFYLRRLLKYMLQWNCKINSFVGKNCRKIYCSRIENCCALISTHSWCQDQNRTQALLVESVCLYFCVNHVPSCKILVLILYKKERFLLWIFCV